MPKIKQSGIACFKNSCSTPWKSLIKQFCDLEKSTLSIFISIFYTCIVTCTTVLAHYAIPYIAIQFNLLPQGIVSYARSLINGTNFLKTTKQYVLSNWFRVIIIIKFNLTLNLKVSGCVLKIQNYSKTSLRNNNNDSNTYSTCCVTSTVLSNWNVTSYFIFIIF